MFISIEVEILKSCKSGGMHVIRIRKMNENIFGWIRIGLRYKNRWIQRHRGWIEVRKQNNLMLGLKLKRPKFSPGNWKVWWERWLVLEKRLCKSGTRSSEDQEMEQKGEHLHRQLGDHQNNDDAVVLNGWHGRSGHGHLACIFHSFEKEKRNHGWCSAGVDPAEMAAADRVEQCCGQMVVQVEAGRLQCCLNLWFNYRTLSKLNLDEAAVEHGVDFVEELELTVAPVAADGRVHFVPAECRAQKD